MRTLNKKEKILFAVAAITLAGVLIANRGGVPLPHFRPLNLSREIQLQQKKIAQALGLLEQQKSIKQESALYAPYVSTSSQDQTPFLIEELTALAEAAQLKLSSVQSAQPQKHGFYIEYTVRFETEGTLSQFMTLLHAVHKSKNLLSVNWMRINPKTDNPELLRTGLVITRSLFFKDIP